jgi:hypothetical protein
MVGTSDTCPSSAWDSVISFFVYHNLINGLLFDEVFCTLKCVYIVLGPSAYIGVYKFLLAFSIARIIEDSLDFTPDCLAF